MKISASQYESVGNYTLSHSIDIEYNSAISEDCTEVEKHLEAFKPTATLDMDSERIAELINAESGDFE